MALTFDEALDTLGAKFCGACGNALDPPGSQCSGCGHLPAVTRPELAEILEAEPGSPARIEADQLRAEAADLMEQVEDKLREADQVLHADGLARARDYAQGVLEAALGERKQAAAVLEQAADAEAVTAAPVADVPALPPLRPFEALPPLPSDLNEAFELMKLAILGHKVSGWRDIARDDVLAVLESLRQLVLAPAE